MTERPAPTELWDAYFKTRSIADRNHLVEHYHSLAQHAIQPFLKSRNDSYDELLSDAHLALIEAIENVGDAPDGVRPSAYLTLRTRGGVIDEIRRRSPGSRGPLKRFRRWSEASLRLRQTLSREPSDQEVERELLIEPGRWSRDLAWGRRVGFSINDPLPGREEELARATTSDEPEVGYQLEADEAFHDMLSAESLTSDEREMLELRYVANCTLAEIAESRGLGSSHICQLLRIAREKVRDHLAVAH